MAQIKDKNDAIFLNKSLETIKGVGSYTAKIFRQIELKTVQDLLEYYPYRYEDYGTVKNINKIKSGEAVTIKAVVKDIQTRRSFKNRRLALTEAVLSGKTGNISAIWFNQPYISNTLKKGREYYFYGKTNFRDRLQLRSPVFEYISKTSEGGGILPVYSLPSGISQKRYRKILRRVLSTTPNRFDPLPNHIKKDLNLLDFKEALTKIHFPKINKDIKKAKKRLSFDELFNFQTQILYRRKLLQKSNAKKIPFVQARVKKFVEGLPFKLTASQKKSAWEIIQDLEKEVPMNRLLQGDVGSGKTVVAAIAAESVVREGGQVSLMAPTEILAQQHHDTFEKLLKPAGVKVALLTGSTPEKEKKEIYKLLSENKVDCIVGTHALLNENIKFKNLNLVIVDEQQRFGVNQRSTLRKIQDVKPVPHLLSMTATPIPRTLALTLYGDLSISSITELPPGRQKVETKVMHPSKRKKAYAMARKELLGGRQVFVICPLLEESDVLEVKSATKERDRLAKDVFPNFSVGLIHGRMKGSEKEKVMQEFKESKHHILVSTSVIEVGIDVPNATVMLVEGAERFGLAQLHQFRGRVGRGKHSSSCILIPSDDRAPERLEALEKHSDGFKLAELDLKFRGMGEVVGVKQSGFMEFKIADPSDLDTIKSARMHAKKIINEGLSNYPRLKETVESKAELLHAE